MSDPDMNLNFSSSLDLVTTPSPPVYLFTMMGIWASLTGLLGIVANILAIGVFIRVKRVITKEKAVGWKIENKGTCEGVFILIFVFPSAPHPV